MQKFNIYLNHTKVFGSLPGYSVGQLVSFDNRRNMTTVTGSNGAFNRETFDQWSDSSAFLFFCLRDLRNTHVASLDNPEVPRIPYYLLYTSKEIRDIIDATFARWDFETDDSLADENARRNDLLPEAYKLSAEYYQEVYYYGFPFGPETRFLSAKGGSEELMSAAQTALIFTMITSIEKSLKLKRSEEKRDSHLIEDIGFHMDSILFRMEFGLSGCEKIGLRIYFDSCEESVVFYTELKKKYRLSQRRKDLSGYRSPPNNIP
uniref:Uncharacterized protein n=1 Tax=Pylaiella littoralis TaxID=2885 RepID=Q94Z16_PYLLI|nr:hypothetical protein PylioMp14 [Pylaiella littoralis]CAC50828.1 hypothetical protein [Pylaiella littoralis]